MIVQDKAISDIKPYQKNPRHKYDINKVAQSIKEFGFQQPIVVDRAGVIIVGHGRYEASKSLNLKTIPVTIADLPPEKAKAYRIADNKTNEYSDWDMGLLIQEFTDLLDNNYDLELTGFDPDELEKIIVGEKEGLTDEDAVPETPEEPISKLGDVYKLGEHRLMCGDSTDTELLEKLMDNQKADMIFTDPPYGVDYKGINNDDREGLEQLLEKSFYHYQFFSKSGASIYCFHSDRCADIFHKTFRNYFHFSSMIIWEKNSLTLSQTDYQSIHEPCLYGWNKTGTHSWFGDRKQTSVWKIHKENLKGHTTPKPVAFIDRALKNSSKSDDIIIDFFGGSGSTMIACEKTNRKCYMMELDPKYIDVIIQRWEQYTGQKAEKIN
jgi:site-specific DNA-methyltransferase (adenine-specific)